jgi:peptidyl-prolyl cis-trans isomerase D
MLKFLRKKENMKKIMWALAILIIPAFVLWGAGSAVRSRKGPNYAGRIFGKKISFRRYDESLQACRTQALLIYGKEFDRVAKFLNLEREAWERLILLYHAKKERIKVPDKEVIAFIRKIPFFHTEKRFDQEKYDMLLEYAFRTAPRNFEEQIRAMITIDKLKGRATEKISLTDEEIKKEYQKTNEKAKALYVFFDPQEFTDQIHPSYEELTAYYRNNKTKFKKSNQVNAEYIALLSEQPPQEKNKQAREDKMWQIAEEIAGEGAAFEKAAENNNLEVKETGFFGAEEFIPEIGLSYDFLKAAFTLEIGEVSNPLETPKGYFIIKIKEKRPSFIPALDETKDAVEKAVIQEQSLKLAEAKGEESLAQIKAMMEEQTLSFAKAAEKLSLEVKETEEFSRTGYISAIGQSREFTLTAFGLNPGGVSKVILVPNGYSILSLKELIPFDEEKFALEKEEFAKKVLEDKKNISFQLWLNNLLKKAELVNNLDKIPAADF